jgi:thiaminase/transcriptional activator TenA
MVEEGEAREQIRIFVEDAMKAEKALNEALSMEIGHDNVLPMPLTTEYMNFTSLYIESGNLPMAIAALLPCIWIYNEVGKYLKSIEKDPANNFYHEWINCYTSPVMDEGVPVMQRLANKLASEGSIQLRAAMRHAFVRSTEMEILFWQQCL